MNDEEKFLYIVACDYFKEEIDYIISNNYLPDVKFVTFESNCNTQKQQKDIFYQIINSIQKDGDRICILGFCKYEYQNEFPGKDIYFYKVDNCFELLVDKNMIERSLLSGYYLLTQSRLENFKDNLIDTGFNEETARGYYKESTKKILLLDTCVSPVNYEKLNELSAFVNIPYETLTVGTDHLGLLINKIVADWRFGNERKYRNKMIAELNKQAADYSMVIEQLVELSSLSEKDLIIKQLLNQFNLLCAPSFMIYYTVYNGLVELYNIEKVRDSDFYFVPEPGMAAIENHNIPNSLLVKIIHTDELMGILLVCDVMFPQYLEYYEKFGYSISKVAGLAVSNARKYQLLKTSEKELKQSNATKDKLFSIISHDLRSPFINFITLTQLMAENVESFKKEELLNISKDMNRNANNIFKLVENLLTWSRMQLGKFKVVPDKINLFKKTDEIIEILSGNAVNKNIIVSNLVHKDLFVLADNSMLQIILQNLIANAIKFSNRGGSIKIYAQVKDTMVETTVEDNGVGINPKIFDLLFKIDSNFSTKGTEKEIGTGLGLSICKEMVEMNNGKIWVESEPGIGTKFSFSLKMA